MTNRIDVVIVGAASRPRGEPAHACGHPHVVLERGQVGQSWRGRWDGYCLVTPNWFLRLPGYPYDGGDPDGFMPRDEIVFYLERYAAGFEAPVRKGIEVISLRQGPDGGFLLGAPAGQTAAGRWSSAPAPSSGPRPAAASTCLLTCFRSISRSTATRPTLPARCWWSGADVRLPDRRGAPRGRPRRVPGLWAGSLVPPQTGRPRPLLVGARDGFPRRATQLAAKPGRSARANVQATGPAAATTSTTGRCGSWASPCSVIPRRRRPPRRSRRPRRERRLGR